MPVETTFLPAFTLAATDGVERSFPTGRHALLCFVHEECETCNMSMALIEGAHRAFGEYIDVWAIGQDSPGNETLIERHGLTLPMLDDDALWTSFNYDLVTVPAIYLTNSAGDQLRHFVGFGRDDWRTLYAELATIAGVDAPDVDWDEYPESRPGCGSRSVEPGIVEGLAAEAEGNPLRARRIEVGELDDVVEFMFDHGFTDGLPVVEPTPERVLRMLSGTRRDAQEVVATVPPNMAPATIEKIAINAVLAGCKPEYLPVVVAAVEAVCNDVFNIHGVMATTMGASPVVIVNGPVRDRIGMNSGISTLGQGNRANASIGRALRLVLRNVGGARPGETERSTQASPSKFTLSFPEWEERGPWVPMLVVCPEHLDTLLRDGWTKQQLRERIQEVTTRPLREILQDAESGAGLPPAMFRPDGPSEEDLDRPVPKFRSTDNIHIVVAGGDAGKFSAVFAGWASGPIGSIPVSRKIEEV